MRYRILSLGDIATPNIMKAIVTFTSVIAAKMTITQSAEIGKAIGGVRQAKR